MISRSSSASTACDKPTESTRSQNTTVICRHSASSAAVWSWSSGGRDGRALGGFDAGAAPSRPAAHCPQNLNVGGFEKPQFGQVLERAAPQPPQNFMFGGLTNVHSAQAFEIA